MGSIKRERPGFFFLGFRKLHVCVCVAPPPLALTPQRWVMMIIQPVLTTQGPIHWLTLTSRRGEAAAACQREGTTAKPPTKEKKGKGEEGLGKKT